MMAVLEKCWIVNLHIFQCEDTGDDYRGDISVYNYGSAIMNISHEALD